MEYNENGFLEELLALKSNSDPWEAATIPIPPGMNEFCNNNGWSFNGFEENPIVIPQNPSLEEFNLPIDHHQTLNSNFTEFYNYPAPFGDEFSSPQQLTDHSSNNNNSSRLDDFSMTLMDDEEATLIENFNDLQSFELQPPPCKSEQIQSPSISHFDMGLSMEKKNKARKVDGQPSKNLMAERRRRKRLNDRLSMLRSVVPKISKMDRTSILGDTIDYMKELVGRINSLQEENDELGCSSDQLNLLSILKDEKPGEAFVRNSPKFQVERRDMDTRIEICCSGRPGLLLSTMTTLEALGLEVQQCVISCFNDFAMQASCSEDLERSGIFSSEDIKQAVFRNAGYGGKCL